MSTAIQAIQAAARKYGIRDWRALAAVAHAESGLNPGSIGDGGSSFGLFQLHQGGALGNMGTSQARQYLDAYKNAEFAARQIRQMGIHHLTGRDAISAFVSKFERPANPSGEIARAYAWYQQGGTGAVPAASSFQAPSTSTDTSSMGQGNDLQAVQDVLSRNAKQFHLPTIKLPASAPSNVSFNLAPDNVHVNDVPPPSTIGGAITRAAKQFLGIRYRWGGTDPKTGLDCSGLVQTLFKEFGITTPRVSEDQFKGGMAVSAAKARPGDLIFFRHANGDVGHVGVYLGNGQFLHAPHTGDVVKISNLKGYGLPVAGFRRYAK